MGLDFRVDTTPRFFMRTNADADFKDTAWEEVEAWKAQSFMEDAAYNEHDGPTEIRVEPLPKIEDPFPHHSDRPHWAYSGFTRFRERLWASIRKPDWPEELNQMYGFAPSHLRIASDDAAYQEWVATSTRFEDLPGGDHPLLKLINHSDCDGDLSPEDCAEMFQSLRDVVNSWDDDPLGHDKGSALALAHLMEVCAYNNRRLIFC